MHKKDLRHERNRHTARRVASARSAVLSPDPGGGGGLSLSVSQWLNGGGGVPSSNLLMGGAPLPQSGRMGYPPPSGWMGVPPPPMVYKVKTLPSVILQLRAATRLYEEAFSFFMILLYLDSMNCWYLNIFLPGCFGLSSTLNCISTHITSGTPL